jgi:hypothetical protein
MAFLGWWWESDGRLVEVAMDGADLVLRYPGVPDEFAPRVPAAGPAAYVIRGGPWDGLAIAPVDRDGVPHLVIGDTLTLARAADGSASRHAVQSVPGPPAAVQPAAEAAYRALLDRALAAGGGVLEPPAGLSVADWVGWASRRQVVLFHGTGDGGIEEFVPRRTSYEVRDHAGRGNHGAVYATDEGWWAMWFAILDRDRVQGSTRNGVETFSSADGRRLPVYFFSLDHRDLAGRPWRDGWLYLLPRAGFQRLGVVPGGPPSHEWCRPAQVAPLARLRVTPGDFPFLHGVSGHDDGDLIRLDDLSRLVLDRGLAIRFTPTGVAAQIRWDDTLAAVSAEYLSLGRKWMPEVAREFRPDPDGATWLHLETTGEFVALLHNRYTELVQEGRFPAGVQPLPTARDA